MSPHTYTVVFTPPRALICFSTFFQHCVHVSPESFQAEAGLRLGSGRHSEGLRQPGLGAVEFIGLQLPLSLPNFLVSPKRQA